METKQVKKTTVPIYPRTHKKILKLQKIIAKENRGIKPSLMFLVDMLVTAELKSYS